MSSASNTSKSSSVKLFGVNLDQPFNIDQKPTLNNPDEEQETFGSVEEFPIQQQLEIECNDDAPRTYECMHCDRRFSNLHAYAGHHNAHRPKTPITLMEDEIMQPAVPLSFSPSSYAQVFNPQIDSMPIRPFAKRLRLSEGVPEMTYSNGTQFLVPEFMRAANGSANMHVPDFSFGNQVVMPNFSFGNQVANANYAMEMVGMNGGFVEGDAGEKEGDDCGLDLSLKL